MLQSTACNGESAPPNGDEGQHLGQPNAGLTEAESPRKLPSPPTTPARGSEGSPPHSNSARVLQRKVLDGVPSQRISNKYQDNGVGLVMKRSILQRLQRRRKNQEMLIGMLIVLNSVFAAIKMKAFADDQNDLTITLFYSIDIVFAILFTAEIALRIFQEGRSFCQSGRNRFSNTVDTIMCLFMILEVFSDTSRVGPILLVCRLLRMLRLFRLFRVMSAFAELRLMLACMFRALRTTFWACVVASLVAYVMSVGVSERLTELQVCSLEEGIQPDDHDICDYFGELSVTFLTLFTAMFGAHSWGRILQVSMPLGTQTMVGLITLMIFSTIALQNVIIGTVTSIVLDWRRIDANEIIHRELEHQDEQSRTLRAIFHEMDIDNSGVLCKDEVELAMFDPRMSALLSAMRLECFDIDSLFRLLDEEGRGVVDLDDFVLGCLRMKGEASAMDMVVIRHQLDHILKILEPAKYDLKHVADEPGKMMPEESGNMSSEYSFFGGVEPTSVEQPVWNRGFVIPRVEMRAMQLSEFKLLRNLVVQLCNKDSWKDAFSGAYLTPRNVSLHDVCYNMICPRTAPDGVILKGLNAEMISPGQKIIQVNAENTSAHCAEGVVECVLDDGAVAVLPSRGRFQSNKDAQGRSRPIKVDGRTVGHLSQVAVPVSISFKELVGKKPTQPLWYCSHTWSQSVLDFVDLCEMHANRRRIPELNATYWVCGYAHRQNSVDLELCVDISKSSFLNSMKLAVGILLIIGKETTVFNRIWCGFELYVNLTDCRKSLDIVAMERCGPDESKPHLLSEELLPGETPWGRADREYKFPVNVLSQGLCVKLENGSASVQADKDHILQYFAENAVRTGNGVDQANAALSGMIARALWTPALRAGCVETFEHCGMERIALPDVLRRDTGRTKLQLNFTQMDEVNLMSVSSVAKGLPPNIQELDLTFCSCPHFNDACLQKLSFHLPEKLTSLILNLLGCKTLSDEGVRALARTLPRGLLTLTLHFDNCHRITMDGLSHLARQIPKSVREFNGTFCGTQVNRNFSSVSELIAVARPKAKDCSSAIRQTVLNGLLNQQL